MLKEKRPNVKVLCTDNYDEFCRVVAEQIQDQIKQKPDSNLALPAGHSPRGYYKLLAQSSQNHEHGYGLDWQRIKCFALDDYLAVEEIYSFKTFFETHLYRFTNLPAAARFNPRFCDNYDQLIVESGGIDLCVLGLGVNGHIAFNEPPTVASSWTHCVFLTEATREANKRDFLSIRAQTQKPHTEADDARNGDAIDLVPQHAVTMGISTILNSKRIVLAVSGEQKKHILRQTLEGPCHASLPASFLGMHNNLLVITDFPFEK